MATLPDLISVAWDIAQESCLRIPMTEPERISQRHFVFAAASAVKEMCYFENEEDVAKLILYCALIVEYAADFLAEHHYKKIPEPTSMRVLGEMEDIKDILKSIQPGDDFEPDRKDELIDALALDLGVDKGQVSRSIASSFERYHEGPQQEAKTFIEQNPNWDHRKADDVKNLAQFLSKSSVSLLALRNENAITFLDILEKAGRSDSVAELDETRCFRTYLRRLSYRSKQHPGAFQLRNVEISPQFSKMCSHGRGAAQKPTEGVFGRVFHAKWSKPDGTIVVVAIKSILDQDSNPSMLFHEAAFWNYLDPNYVVPFYGAAFVYNSPCLVSLWMDGGRICCYVDGKEDSIRLDLLRQVADGIKYLHDLNFVHSNIKPENILIKVAKAPKAFITSFGFSNATHRTHVAYTKTWGYAPGYVSSGDVTPWDPRNDIYAFGVTCCQIVLVNKRTHIGTIPEDIHTCISRLSVVRPPPVGEDPNEEGSKGPRQRFIQTLRQKFFPSKKPRPFFQDIFDLVANTCYIRTCNIDDVIKLLKGASDFMRYDPNMIAIARDIAQESCLRIPMTEPERFSQRHFVFVAATAVNEMCDDPRKEKDVAELILYCALIVEYAADFLVKYPHTKIPESAGLSVPEKMEHIMDMMKSIEPGYDLEAEIHKNDLIEAFALDLGVVERRVSRSIVSSFERYREGPQQEAKTFIEQNPNWDHRKADDVKNLAQFLSKSSVSLLALRNENAVTFLDILEKATRSDSVAEPDEMRCFRTYLRRLSHRSKQHPGAFQLCNIEYLPHVSSELCTHGKGESQKSTAGGFGKVRRAKWSKPDGTIVMVATKSLLDQDSNPSMLFHEAAFWYYLDPSYVVPFYGAAFVDNSPCLVSLWMDGGRICCYVDGKSDSIRLDLLRQVADGIKYLHDLNFVHSDIKPENVLIKEAKPPKAFITDFGFSNATHRTHVAYTKTCGHTPGYVSGSDAIPWDPRNDIYAFGVTCCQVVLVGKRTHIWDIPGDINTCISRLPVVQPPPVGEDPNEEGSKGPRQRFIQKLRQKFFPFKSPPPFFQEIFDLVANTCYIRTCNIDDVINLLGRAAEADRTCAL